ncbi:hypothetical protein C1701_23570 [Actinoalloteichus sp. AHMU CJ021]|uniref:Small multidrug efflux protein n=1 Tax=Actinoalloteichus caeruleus DSM 43889 TaxID=1120930 RepID=A0ABT1JCN2_ACTCY|nr:hypothetical protein [Actinoalloteichus caeruleus]AUS80829.1 hypothetical protein C1701_23570 [Actinoalloteichus sp. AHMU CJ021]MCP2330245.1 hypothetical protein [Actinoalloteichus caeruleus DSM 43889]
MESNFITDLFAQLAEFAAGAETWQQVGVLLIAGAIPFIESYLGSFLGVLVGVPAGLAVPAAILGNVIVTFALIALASKARVAATRRRGNGGGGGADAPRRKQKIAKYLDRFGVPGVCLLGPIVVASQITAPALVALGATKRSVYVWQAVAIVAWGVLFGFFGDLAAGWFM